MKILIAAISSTRVRKKSGAANVLAAEYISRASRYTNCEASTYASEVSLLHAIEERTARTLPHLILLDSRGKLLSSDDFATYIGHVRDAGTQLLLLVIGPPDGWSPAIRNRADLILSFGPITLPHELAYVVLAEQVYRALTILAGHPYHSGH